MPIVRLSFERVYEGRGLRRYCRQAWSSSSGKKLMSGADCVAALVFAYFFLLLSLHVMA